MERDVKKKKLDFKCSECKKRYSLKELKELSYVEEVANYIIVTCPNCSSQDTWER